MPEATVTVSNPLGLHARAAAQLVKTAGVFRSRVTIDRTDRQISANAKSILSVLSLAASRGTELRIKVEGEDEDAALKAVVGLFNNGFGEI